MFLTGYFPCPEIKVYKSLEERKKSTRALNHHAPSQRHLSVMRARPYSCIYVP